MEIITLQEAAKVLRYEGDKAEVNARKWLYKHGLKQFATGKYVREQFEELLEERGKGCLAYEKEGSTTTSGGRCVWGRKPSLSKNNLLALIDSRIQENMSPSLSRT